MIALPGRNIHPLYVIQGDDDGLPFAAPAEDEDEEVTQCLRAVHVGQPLGCSGFPTF